MEWVIFARIGSWHQLRGCVDWIAQSPALTPHLLREFCPMARISTSNFGGVPSPIADFIVCSRALG